jgi:ATP-dependent RNA helicase DDX51/DBP6
MRKYVHRVGRTARAGRAGDAWTLVEKQEVRGRLSLSLRYTSDQSLVQARYFKTVLREADHLEKVKRLRVSEKDLAPLTPYYEVCSFRKRFDILLTMNYRLRWDN